MASCLILTPTEVIKQNAQVLRKDTKESATVHVLKRFRRHPWRLWSGYAALVSRNLPFTGLNFPLFERIKKHMIDGYRQSRRCGDRTDNHTHPIMGCLSITEFSSLTGVSAGISGTVVAVLTTPIDVVKTRLMLAAIANDEKPKTVIDIIKSKILPGRAANADDQVRAWAMGRDIFRKEGIKGLFRGGIIRAVWTGISQTLYLGMYEAIKLYLSGASMSEVDNG